MKINISINYLFFLFFTLPSSLLAHDGQDERIQYWKDYFHPKLEVVRQDIPDVKINLKKIGPFFQLQTQVENFKITPDQDLKNNNTWTGYVKLFINGVYTSRIYSEYFFIKESLSENLLSFSSIISMLGIPSF